MYQDNIEQRNLLDQFLAKQGVHLSQDTLNKLYKYADLVVKTKEFGNLISENDSKKFLSRHVADSLIPYIYIDNIINSKKTDLSSKRWADMGAGAGCPVFPLAIAMPQVEFYAVEPRNKRVQFMQMAKEKLQLENLTVIGKRFETSELSDLDFISCRALSTFENDWERAHLKLKKGGFFITLKSYNSISQLERNPDVSVQTYTLLGEEQIYALVTRGNL